MKNKDSINYYQQIARFFVNNYSSDDEYCTDATFRMFYVLLDGGELSASDLKTISECIEEWGI